MTRVGWLDASSGISGDMLLGALIDAGVPLHVIQDAINSLPLPERIRLSVEQVTRNALAAAHVHVRVPETHHHRKLPDILTLLEGVDDDVRDSASATFIRLAEAEARVHRSVPEEVHFHEVGALDSIADIVGAAAGIRWLALDQLVCSPIAVGGGRVQAAHGSIPVPVPAVAELLAVAGAPAFAGPANRELATPTGVALAVTFADSFGAMPALTLKRTGTGAGSWDPCGHANVLRLLIGEASNEPAKDTRAPTGAIVLEVNRSDFPAGVLLAGDQSAEGSVSA
ncbi:LarC family nickel insertion protein [Streptomyces sp. NPDC051776]|uniref:LarC family nickel insertion protein n=1 Tax=Streptomyces sp. NPDC051776 TaxID=3155414 RepID=UPI00343A71B8